MAVWRKPVKCLWIPVNILAFNTLLRNHEYISPKQCGKDFFVVVLFTHPRIPAKILQRSYISLQNKCQLVVMLLYSYYICPQQNGHKPNHYIYLIRERLSKLSVKITYSVTTIKRIQWGYIFSSFWDKYSCKVQLYINTVPVYCLFWRSILR